MIQLRAKKKYFYYSLIRGIVTAIGALPAAIYALYIFFFTIIHPTVNIETGQLMLIWLSIPVVSINLFFVIFGAYYKKHLRNDVIYEFYEIVTLTKLPKKLPKVVYVYTAHGDMMPARVIQNSMQTYKNMEVWISEGSEKIDVIESSRKFASEHGFKFFAVGGKGSSNKADNLNAFLKRACPSYDFLLITDADEVLDKNFVDYAIRCFNWPKFRNLGYVSCLNYLYTTDNFFSNVFGNNETKGFLYEDFPKTFSFGEVSNLYSASCLVSYELLKKHGGFFPEGCNEDFYLESFALRHGYSTVMIPNTPGSQAFDKDVFANEKRYMRIYDWVLRLIKNTKYSQYNEKCKSWYDRIYISSILYPLILILKWTAMALLIWILILYHGTLFRSPFFIYTLSISLGTLVISFIANIIFIDSITVYNKYFWVWLILQPMYYLYIMPYRLKHWFNAVIRSKYSQFGGSGVKRNSKNRSLICLFALFLCLVVITTFTLIYVYVIRFDNKNLMLLYIFICVIFGDFSVSYLCTTLMNIMGKIKYKLYNPKDFIQHRKFFKFEKIKSKFINDHKNKSKYDLDLIK